MEFNEKEKNIILSALKNHIGAIRISCIYCELVDLREDYGNTAYCENYCTYQKSVNEINEVIKKF